MPINRKTRDAVSQLQPSDLSDYELFAQRFPDFIEHLQLLRKEWHSRLKRLSGKSRTEQHHEVRKLIRSRHHHVLFAYETIKRTHSLRHASPEAISDLASQFDPFHAVINEHVATRNVSTSPTRKRFVQDFGPRRRMHQYAVSNILRFLHPPPENQKLFNGGMPSALRAIEAAFSEGATHGCEIDFVDFYGSVTLDGLADLMRPLASSLTQHVVWDNAYPRDPASSGSAIASSPVPTPERPNGLSLGSATSPIVGEIIIAHLLAAAQLDDVVTYADNLFVFGRSGEEVDARIQSLRDCISSDDFGFSGLSFRRGEVCQIERERAAFHGLEVKCVSQSGSGVEFAKHYGQTSTSGWSWSPSAKKHDEFKISARDYVSVEQVERAIRQVSNWRRYYRDWPDGDKHEARHIAELKARRFLLERTAINLTEAAAAICDAAYLWQGDLTVDQMYPDFDADLDNKVRQRLAIYEVAALRIRSPV